MEVTSTSVTSSATRVSDSTSGALPSPTRSLWFHALPASGDAFALPPSTTHTVAGAVGLTVAAAGRALCGSGGAPGARVGAPGAGGAVPLVIAVDGADAAGAASVVVAAGDADAAASGDVDV